MNVQLLIDNVKQPASEGKTYQRHDSLSGKTVTTGAAASVADALTIARSSQQAFEQWSKVGPTERRRLLLAAADVLISKMPEFCSVWPRRLVPRNFGHSSM